MKLAQRVLGLAMVSSGCVAPVLDAPPAPPQPTVSLVDGGDDAAADLSVALPQRDLGLLVPWRAVNLIGPGPLVWEEYDYRPRAQGGLREEIDARLERLRQIGVRQVQIQTLSSWSVETAPAPGTSIQATVYYRAAYDPNDPSTWGKVPRSRRGDMGVVAYQPPAAWDVPTPLRTPLEINRKAEQVLGDMLDAVRAHGLIPVLKVETYLTLAEDGGAGGTTPWFNFTDPSRGFDAFYARYQEHLVSMAHLGARHGAAMLILGTETPYVAGAGQGRFADGSKMTDRQALIAGKWRGIIAAVRQALREEGRLDMVLSYTEINPFWDDREPTEPRVPIWSRVPFWDDLDAVGINLYLPGRWSDGAGSYDRSPKTAQDMVAYGEAHNFATDYVPNLQDLRDFFVGKKGYDLMRKPVFFAEDGCAAAPYAAVNPAAPPVLVLGAAPDVAEQASLYDAHFQLFEKHGAGWLAGLGFWQATPGARWGGAWSPANKAAYGTPAAYFSFLGTATEDVVARHFARY